MFWFSIVVWNKSFQAPACPHSCSLMSEQMGTDCVCINVLNTVHADPKKYTEAMSLKCGVIYSFLDGVFHVKGLSHVSYAYTLYIYWWEVGKDERNFKS